MAQNVLLEMEGVTKRFPGVVALDAVDLLLNEGETHILLGENGAGKSTLVKILSGIYPADEGTIRYNGSPYQPASTSDALETGIRLIHQEFNLLNYLSVAENLLFNDLPNRAGFVNFQKLNRRARELLDEVGLDVSPSTPVERLSVAQKQMVEIAKALSGESKLLIMDEPTAALADKEITRLFEIIHRLKTKGVTIIYISHRLQEIFEIGDRFTVLRNGQKVVTQPLEGTSVDEIVRMMVGREVSGSYPFREEVELGEELLRVENLKPSGSAHAVSFSARSGEILGISGLVGAGRTEILRAVFGADEATGAVQLEGQAVQINHPTDAVEHGISLLTENRKEEGLLLDLPYFTNVTLTNLSAVTSGALLNSKAEYAAAERFVEELNVKTPSIHQDVRNLSGGNQQKVVLAKWLFRNARVLMVDEPTRGIDVGAKYEIYQLLWDLAAQGKAVIVVSSDLPELIGICHRILVVSDGKITGELTRDEFDQESILSLAYQEYTRERNAA